MRVAMSENQVFSQPGAVSDGADVVGAILGAILVFTCMGLYPKMFTYLVDVFGPTMYLYSIIHSPWSWT